MIETPHVLTETPDPTGDLLSDLLNGMRLAGTVLFRARFREPWSVDTPEACHLNAMLPLNSAHLVPFHVIASGGCWVELPGQAPVWLEEGDAVLLPYGAGHRLRGREDAEAVAVATLLPGPPWDALPVVEHGGTGPATSLICGFVQCDELMFHPLMKHLPPLLHVSPEASPADFWLATTIKHTATEASRPLPGSRSMLPRLTELMFVEILRKHMQGLSAGEVGWFAAYNSPVVGPALRLMHAKPFDAWSVEGLARAVGVSRTVLADHFKRLLDQPPMHYLVRWRLQLAAQALRSDGLPVKTVADRCGYESEAAFARAFKRCFGAPPGDWRRRQRGG